jgi:hypothetical protein
VKGKGWRVKGKGWRVKGEGQWVKDLGNLGFILRVLKIRI